MRMCVVCETPFQCFNALNFIFNQTEYSLDEVDMFIGGNLSEPEKIGNKIKKQNQFSNVYTYSYCRENNNKVYELCCNVFKILFPVQYLRSITSETISFKYDVVFYSTMSRFVTAICVANPGIKCWLYDDGLGSYVGNQAQFKISKKRLILLRVKGVNENIFIPQILFLNNPKMNNSRWDIPIKPLPQYRSSTEAFRKIVLTVFGSSKELYLKKRFVYLGVPLWSDNAYSTTKKVLNAMPKEAIYRKHPLEKDIISCNIHYDNINTLWEVVCDEAIHDEHVLISYCSTAQVIPKLIFDREPYIIFTSLLFDDIPDDIETINELIGIIKKSYRNSDKVFVPKSLEEFSTIIRSLSDGNRKG